MEIKKIGLLSTHEFGGYVRSRDLIGPMISFDELGCVFTAVTSPVTGDEGMLDIYDKMNPQNSGTVYVHDIEKRINLLSFMTGEYKKEVDNA